MCSVATESVLEYLFDVKKRRSSSDEGSEEKDRRIAYVSIV